MSMIAILSCRTRSVWVTTLPAMKSCILCSLVKRLLCILIQITIRSFLVTCSRFLILFIPKISFPQNQLLHRSFNNQHFPPFNSRFPAKRFGKHCNPQKIANFRTEPPHRYRYRTISLMSIKLSLFVGHGKVIYSPL